MDTRDKILSWLTSWQLWHAVFQICLAVAPQLATIFHDNPHAIMAVQVLSALCAACELYGKPQIPAANVIPMEIEVTK